jgi:hypothetical protein
MATKKIFTYREARELIFLVREVTHKAFMQAESIANELHAMGLADGRRSKLEEQYEAVVTEWADHTEDLGCEIKGLWLVDFDNGEGYYCWKYPEKNLDHFHTYEEGFSGRMRIN